MQQPKCPWIEIIDTTILTAILPTDELYDLSLCDLICIYTKILFNATLEREERKKSEFDVRMDL